MSLKMILIISNNLWLIPINQFYKIIVKFLKNFKISQFSFKDTNNKKFKNSWNTGRRKFSNLQNLETNKIRYFVRNWKKNYNLFKIITDNNYKIQIIFN